MATVEKVYTRIVRTPGGGIAVADEDGTPLNGQHIPLNTRLETDETGARCFYAKFMVDAPGVSCEVE